MRSQTHRCLNIDRMHEHCFFHLRLCCLSSQKEAGKHQYSPVSECGRRAEERPVVDPVWITLESEKSAIHYFKYFQKKSVYISSDIPTRKSEEDAKSSVSQSNNLYYQHIMVIPVVWSRRLMSDGIGGRCVYRCYKRFWEKFFFCLIIS